MRLLTSLLIICSLFSMRFGSVVLRLNFFCVKTKLITATFSGLLLPLSCLSLYSFIVLYVCPVQL